MFLNLYDFLQTEIMYAGHRIIKTQRTKKISKGQYANSLQDSGIS